MYFRVRYIIRDFEFGDAQISVSDPAKQIDVLISKRPGNETHPPFEPNQGVATATCQKELPVRHHAEAVASGSLSAKREIVGQVSHDIQETILHTLRLVRWRANCQKSGLNPIQWSVEFSWSLDGTVWKPVADNSGFRFALIHSPRWTNETEEFVRTEVLGELDEPLGHELLREAAANRSINLRSSLILAVAAAEVGFKQFASRTFPDTEWILELPSPPLEKMLEHFPWSKLGVQICGKVPSIPVQIARELKKAVNLRNQIVHAGAPKGVAKLKGETVDSVLSAVRDMLYFLDALQGQTWAASHMSAGALEQFYER